jgi:N-methylhydantoinase B/oxoprolinase/acetone carboxylase alpha subunit
MTNSRLTDPEVLESRYPVLVEAFSIRRGSGGAGAHRGGDGVVRRIGFREPMTATCCRTGGVWRRSGWRAAARARWARHGSSGRTARCRC